MIMNNEQIDLYHRIQAYSLNRSGSKLSFSKRLARDNDRSQAYTKQAIANHLSKIFSFLAQLIATFTNNFSNPKLRLR